MSLFVADFICQRFADLTPTLLRKHGVTVVLVDLDNTLIPYSLSMPTEELLDWRARLAEAGITLFVVSNNRHGTRVVPFCEAMDVPYLLHARKPSPYGFREALRLLDADPAHTLAVGDQVYTDVVGAHRAGIRAALVHPIDLKHYPLLALRYGLEAPFRRRAASHTLD